MITLPQPLQGNLNGRSLLSTGLEVEQAGHGIVGITGLSISAIFKRLGLIIAVNHQITTTVAIEPATKSAGKAK